MERRYSTFWYCTTINYADKSMTYKVKALNGYFNGEIITKNKTNPLYRGFVTAENPFEAIKIIQEYAERLKLVLSSINLYNPKYLIKPDQKYWLLRYRYGCMFNARYGIYVKAQPLSKEDAELVCKYGMYELNDKKGCCYV